MISDKYLSIVGWAMPTKTRILWAMPTLRICSKNQIVTLYDK